MLLVKNNVLPLVDADVEVGHPADGPADDVQVVPSVVVAPLGEEGAVDVAQVVVDGAPAAVAPGQAAAIDYRRVPGNGCTVPARRGLRRFQGRAAILQRQPAHGSRR